MGRGVSLHKKTDYEGRFRCCDGLGIVREEVWTNAKSEIVRYNLAFILPHRSSIDSGRVLGYDNAHGRHERHFCGVVEEVEFTDYESTSTRFFEEVELLRRSYEN